MDRELNTVNVLPARTSRQSDRCNCVILVPFSTHIVPGCEQGLIELQRRGYEVWRVGGYSAIDIGRSEMATKALALTPSPLPEGEGFQETFWIDSDIEFEPDAVDRLRSHGLPITAGIYARKGSRAIAAHTLPGTTQAWHGQGQRAGRSPLRRHRLPARPPRGLRDHPAKALPAAVQRPVRPPDGAIFSCR